MPPSSFPETNSTVVRGPRGDVPSKQNPTGYQQPTDSGFEISNCRVKMSSSASAVIGTLGRMSEMKEEG